MALIAMQFKKSFTRRKEVPLMFGDNHVHMVLDGVYYKDAINRHRRGGDERFVRETLAKYRDAGVTYLRDGGDRFGACTMAARLAPEYGIEYRTPFFPICRKGHYGEFIGRSFTDFSEYRTLLSEIQAGGGDFVKFMASGIMDFDHFGAVTSEPLKLPELKDMVSAAHDMGFAVMVHVNGAEAVRNTLLAGADSIEHGAYQDDECLHLLAESGATWVPTAVTIGNLRGKRRYDERAVEQILESHLQNIETAHRYGAKLALGSDAGAWEVFHVDGITGELSLFRQVLGTEAEKVLQAGGDEIKTRFRRKM